MAQILETFSFANVSVYVAGAKITGFGDGDSVELSRSEDNTTTSVGADGSVGHAYTANKTGTLTMTLQQTAPVNLVFAALQNKQDKDKKPVSFPVVITDDSGSFFAELKEVHIVNPPSLTLGDSYGSRTWTFFVSEIDYTPAPGAVKVASAINAMIAQAIASVSSSDASSTGGNLNS